MSDNSRDVFSLPARIHNELVVHYLYYDVLKGANGYRRFFGMANNEIAFLKVVAYGLIPRLFDEDGFLADQMIIYEEDQEVAEMYFIVEGIVGVCFSVMARGGVGQSMVVSKVQEGEQIIGDHYIVNKQRSQFIYKAMARTSAFAIRCDYLHDCIIPAGKDFGTNLRASVYNYYKKWIFKPVYNHRWEYIQNVNRKTS